MYSEPDMSAFNVEFNNVRFYSATPLSVDISLQLLILIHTNGDFEVVEGTKAIVSGSIRQISNEGSTQTTKIQSTPKDALILDKSEVYRELQLRGYKYGKEFRAINSYCRDDNSAKVQWFGRWDTFMDAISQIYLFANETRMMHLAVSMRKVRINAVQHMNWVKSLGQRKKKLCDIKYCKKTNTIIGGGIEFHGIQTHAIERRKPDEIEALESYEFVPLIDDERTYAINDAVRICLQLIIEKLTPKMVNILEVSDEINEPIIEHFRDVILTTPKVNATFKIITKKSIKIDSVQIEAPGTKDATKYTIAIASSQNISNITDKVSPQGFVIMIKSTADSSNLSIPKGFCLISSVKTANFSMSILQEQSKSTLKYKIIPICSEDREFTWLNEMQEAETTDDTIVVADRDKMSGVLGFINSLRCEPIVNSYRCVIIEDVNAPPFDVADPFYGSQLCLGLPVNILRNGKWGTFRHLVLNQEEVDIQFNSPLCVQLGHLGNLQSLEWVPVVNSGKRIQVHYASLSSIDYNLATAKQYQELFNENSMQQFGQFGREFSGMNSSGERIMGVKIGGGTLATEISVSPNDFVFNIPRGMTLEDAATIPLTHLLIYSALFTTGGIENGPSILIEKGLCCQILKQREID